MILPKVVIRNYTLNDLHKIKHPSYRQVMDLLIDYIVKNNLQDENNRITIILDDTIKRTFDLSDNSLKLHELYNVTKNFVNSCEPN
jgi:chromatin remodeling complex protein RSC6